jgi:hypothetical protein
MSAGESKINLTKKQLKILIATARTPDDHLKLARHYDEQAANLLAEATDHDEMAAAYRKNPMNTGSKFITSTVGHCEYFANAEREKAEKMKEIAAEHRAIAGNADK